MESQKLNGLQQTYLCPEIHCKPIQKMLDVLDADEERCAIRMGRRMLVDS